MAGNIIEIPDDDVVYEDISFLAELAAVESHALSLSSAKRRRTTTTTPPPSSAASDPSEGAYTAALKGSRSLTWKNQSSTTAAVTVTPPTRGVGGSGACYKCGMEGHWARDCSVLNAVTGSESEVVKACACGLGSCLVLTANTERNRGRKFFRCPVRQENGGCGYFEWCDESSGDNASVQERARKSGRQQEVYQHPSNRETTGFTRTWDDYNKGSSASSTPTSGYGAVSKFETADNKGYGIKTGSSCFKCGEEGHWARDCPGTSSNTPTGAREKSSSDGSFTRSWDDYNKGTSTPNSGYGIRTGSSCFKCGKEGHWARDCPTTPSSNLPTGVQEKSSSDGCYKCGQSGHWAKDCPQNQVRYH